MKQLKKHVNKSLRMVGMTAAGLLTILLTNVLPAKAEPPLGSRSFLSRHVHSVAELKRQLQQDPRLIRIYSELLHMTPEQVKTEFSKLKLTHLQEEGVYKVYGVIETPSGLQYSFKVRRLPKGIDIFTLDDGKTPVILKQCGNLLRGYYTTPGPVANSVPVFNEMAPDALLPNGTGVVNEAVTLESPVQSEWGWVEDTYATAPTPSIYPPPPLAHSVARAWWPWLFPLIGIPFIGSGGGGGGGGTVSTFGAFPLFIPDTSSALAAIVQPGIDFVPEPGSASLTAALFCSALALTLWRRRVKARSSGTGS